MATRPATDAHENEDFVAAIPNAVVLLDGAGLSGTDSGCNHGVAWFSRNLGSTLIARLTAGDGGELPELLAGAIKTVADSHAHTCDLAHVGTPSATVIIARIRNGQLEHLVLADSVLVVRQRGGCEQVICDTREADAARPFRDAMTSVPHGTPMHEEARRVFMSKIRDFRNKPGGFWVAAANPAAAYEALLGHHPIDQVQDFALLSDGASRMVDRFNLATWTDTLALLDDQGPAALIAEVRAAERSDPEGTRWPRGKTYDDATAAYCAIS
ncbi:protein phosphatase 2C domain-containing protein [Actinoplanes sp. NPDC051343]|uniref:protein phosphatase 2C domain-containing protein n=1 Tax=Actinoplanes sp. NPDC051343 TaxID=3363906 RepID=UPI0037A5D29C